MFNVLLFFSFLFSLSVFAYSGGSGTADAPYLISNVTDLNELRTAVNSGQTQAGIFFQVAQNIVLNGEWDPIGITDKPFLGTFDGNNMTISKFSKTSFHDGGFGFFSVVRNATIKYIILT